MCGTSSLYVIKVSKLWVFKSKVLREILESRKEGMD
jgi:hypothetical protein